MQEQQNDTSTDGQQIKHPSRIQPDKGIGEDEMRKEARKSESLSEGSILGNVAFWSLLEEVRDVRVPMFIKNILSLANLDSPLTLKKVNGQTLTELESFAREGMQELVEDEDLKLFYGRFYKKPDKFRFLVGDRYLIEELVSFVRSKPDEFWQGCSSSNATAEFSVFKADSPIDKSSMASSELEDRESLASDAAEQSRSEKNRAGLWNLTGARRRTQFLRGLREAAVGPEVVKSRVPESRLASRRSYYGKSFPGRFFQRNPKK